MKPGPHGGVVPAPANVACSIASSQWQSYAVKRQTVLERKRMELEEAAQAAAPKGVGVVQLGQGVGVVGQGLTGGLNLVTGKDADADHARQLQEVSLRPPAP